MSKYKINPGIIETIECMILYRIIDSDTREPWFAQSRPVNQHIEHRQQHDAREVRNHQSNGYRESLIVENGSGNTTHKNQWYKHRNGSQRGTEHRGSCHLIQARFSEYPLSRYWEIFSVTMMELSIIIPSARINPDRDMMFSDILNK